MCGRYASTTPPEQMAKFLKIAGPIPNFPPRYNVAPTHDVPAVRFDPETRRRSLDFLRWGLIPRWSKDAGIGAKLINARGETVADKLSFRDAFAKRRCLLPADAFYEWTKSKPKQPYAVCLKRGALFAFAGLWENWKNPEGCWVRTCTIVITGANELLAPVHERMPVILDPMDYFKWLGEEPAGPEDPAALLEPFPADAMEIFKVGLRVNSVANDDPSLMTPLD